MASLQSFNLMKYKISNLTNCTIYHTIEFSNWLKRLDRSITIRIDQRIQRLADGNPGLHKRFDHILEIKWTTGTMGSFRIYCAEYNGLLLLLGGHKDKQGKDIKFAKALLEGVKIGTVRKKIYK